MAPKMEDANAKTKAEIEAAGSWKIRNVQDDHQMVCRSGDHIYISQYEAPEAFR